MKFDIDAGEVYPMPPGLSGKFEWSQYPQSLFENWTREQVDRSQMLTKCSDRELSTVYKLNVLHDGCFDDRREVRTVRRVDTVDQRAYWNYLETPVSGMYAIDLETKVDMIVTFERPSASSLC